MNTKVMIFNEDAIFDMILCDHPLLPQVSRQIMERHAQRVLEQVELMTTAKSFKLDWRWMIR